MSAFGGKADIHAQAAARDRPKQTGFLDMTGNKSV
jgi:hypothetical protein